jgi:hypothetical protein
LTLADGTAPTSDVSLIEVYPGAAWPVLAQRGRLPRKQALDGRSARQRLLLDCGVTLPDRLLTHDELDATIAAYTAFLLRHGGTEMVGESPVLRDDGTIVEGFIVQPKLLSESESTGPTKPSPSP